MKLTIGFKPKKDIEVGQVIHLKVVSLQGDVAQVEDVTPFTGVDVFYTCLTCGLGEVPGEHGGLPAGWSAVLLENGSHVFFCDTDCMTNAPKYCRVCGCTDERGCYKEEIGEPCHWVEPDLCSYCAPAELPKELPNQS